MRQNGQREAARAVGRADEEQENRSPGETHCLSGAQGSERREWAFIEGPWVVLQGLCLLECPGGHSRWLLVTLTQLGSEAGPWVVVARRPLGLRVVTQNRLSSEGYPCMAVLGSQWDSGSSQG